MSYAILTIAACALLNRLRGDDRWMRRKPAEGEELGKKFLPGHARFYVSAAIWVVATSATGDAWRSLLWPLAFLLWSWPPWGFLIGLGRWTPQDRKISRLEQTLLNITRGSVHLALALRMLFILPGLLALFSWEGAIIAVPFALFSVLFYELAWRLRPSNPIIVAELMTGALWGLLITGS